MVPPECTKCMMILVQHKIFAVIHVLHLLAYLKTSSWKSTNSYLNIALCIKMNCATITWSVPVGEQSEPRVWQSRVRDPRSLNQVGFFHLMIEQVKRSPYSVFINQDNDVLVDIIRTDTWHPTPKRLKVMHGTLIIEIVVFLNGAQTKWQGKLLWGYII